MKPIFLVFVLLALAVGCLVGPFVAPMTKAWMFLLAAAVYWLSTGVLAIISVEKFGRPTNGTSGKIGAAYLWIMLRVILAAIVFALGMSLVLSYTTALVINAVLFLVLDALLILS